MRENDREVAAYRDLVLWRGVLISLSVEETSVVCKKVLSRSGVIEEMIGLGFFVLDDGEGAILAIPKHKLCVKAVSDVLRTARLDSAAKRLVGAARRKRKNP